MKQICQNLRNGQTSVLEVPAPGLSRGMVLIQTRASLISAGTERMLVEFGKASLIAKARSQPDKVKQVLEKIRTDGLLPTYEAVFSRLDEPLPLGYCNAGLVLEVGPDVTEFQRGDRVASNGPHAEIVAVPKTLCAKIPDGVSDEQAAFTVLSSVGLQGLRLLAPQLGERYVVYGLGLIGLVSVQLLRAGGCAVLGVDINPARLKLAQQYGAAVVNAGAGGDPVAAAAAWTEGKGVDGVLITASAKSDQIIHQSALMCRKRGKIVLVGVVGLDIRRSDFYEKELTFQVSCSYGPGRYDEAYEQAGQDYPLPYVRWTEQRNFQAVLESLRDRRLVVDDLITHRFDLHQAPQAYQTLASDPSVLGIVLQYKTPVQDARVVSLPVSAGQPQPGVPCVALVGAGNYAKATVGPILSKLPIRRKYVVAATHPHSAMHLASRCGFAKATTDLDEPLRDPEVNVVFIVTRPDSHAPLAQRALTAGKHVLVEKPMVLWPQELAQVIQAVRSRPDRQYMVGFNRRFSPHVRKMQDLLAGRSEPLAMHYAVNAGAIPPGTWFHDRAVNGGRIIAEGCHFIDLLRFLAGSPITAVSAMTVGRAMAVTQDKMSIVLSFADGSIGTVNYFANGAKAYPKEIVEVYSQGRILHLLNFRRLRGYGFKGFRQFKTWRQDKGHRAEFEAFFKAVSAGGPSPIPLEEMVNVTLATFAAVTAAQEKRVVQLDTEYPDLQSHAQ